MRRFARTVSLLLALSCLVLPVLLVGCSAKRSSAEEKAVVMTVGGYDVSYELYRYVVLTLRASYDNGDPSYWDTAENREEMPERIRSGAEETLRQLFSVLSLCESYGIHADDASVRAQADAAVAEDESQYENEKSFVAALKESFMTFNVYHFLQRVAVCSDTLFYAMVNDGTIPSDEASIRAFFDTDEVIRIKQVLIDPARQESEEAALALAEHVRAEALSGKDFDTLVKQYGNDLYMFNNTDGYYLMKGLYHLAFEEASFSLSVGEISEVIKTPSGYSVLLRLEKDPTYPDRRFEEFSKSFLNARFSLILEERAASLKVAAGDRLARYDVLTISMN